MSDAQEESLKSEIMVLRDYLSRSRWYLGKDKQSKDPTKEEIKEFLWQVRQILKGD